MPHDTPSALEVLTADWLGTLTEVGSYTPVLTGDTTNPNIGAAGFILGDWHRSLHMIDAWVRVRIEGSGAARGAGALRWTLPFPADLDMMVSGITATPASAIGAGYARSGVTAEAESTTVLLCAAGQSGSGTAGGAVLMSRTGSQAAILGEQFTFGGGDVLRFTFHARYPADPASLP